MSIVWKEIYKIVGDGIPIAELFFADRKAAIQAHLDFAKNVGGVAFRPDYNGNWWTIIFDSTKANWLPDGWRKIGREENGLTEARPNRSTKLGKAAIKRREALPRILPQSLVPIEFAVSHLTPTDDMALHFPIIIDIALPEPMYFVQVPRKLKDGWEPNALLELCPMQHFMDAVEAHNALVQDEKS